MGCGSSNTLETSEFRIMEQNKKTQFHKMLENYKTISNKIGDKINHRSNNVAKQEIIDELVNNFVEDNKDGKLSKEEIRECFTYAIIKKFIIEAKLNVPNTDGSMIKDFVSKVVDIEKRALAQKVFKENTGDNYNSLFIDIDTNTELIAPTLRIIKYDPEYLSYSSMVIVFPEKDVESLESIRELAFLIKAHPFKNLVVGLLEENLASSLENLSLLFEAIALSKSLKNFSLVKISVKPLVLKPETINKIVMSIARSKLNSLGLIHFTLPEMDKLRLLEAIYRNSNINFVGLQEIGCDEKEVGQICKNLSKSKSLRCLMIGSKVEDVEGAYSRNQEYFKNNKMFEGLVLGYFKG